MKPIEPEHEKRLEAVIDAQLKELGELTAPATLAPRVMQEIARREARAWYRSSWEAWPLALRVASAGGLTAVFCALFFGASKLDRAAVGQGSGEMVNEWFPGVTALWRALGVLVETVHMLLSHVRIEYVAVVVAIFFMAWVALIGVGTVCVRVAIRPVSRMR